MRAVIKATGTLREEDVPEPVMSSLVEAFRTISGQSS
jgi:hypothetical protein